jgi:minor curlin subunit
MLGLILFKGDSNQLEIDKEANQQKIVQVGQNNSIKDLQFTNNNVNMELTQQGNNQNIQNFGSNSIYNEGSSIWEWCL